MVISINSVSPRTVSSIIDLVTVDGKHITTKNHLIADIKNRIKQVSLNSRRDFIRTCLNKQLSTREISSLAKKTVSKLGDCPRQFKEERRILRLRILEKDRQIADCNRMIHSHMRAVKDICLSDIAMTRYKTIRKRELNA